MIVLLAKVESGCPDIGQPEWAALINQKGRNRNEEGGEICTNLSGKNFGLIQALK